MWGRRWGSVGWECMDPVEMSMGHSLSEPCNTLVKFYFHDTANTYCVNEAEPPFPGLSSLHCSCERGPPETSYMRCIGQKWSSNQMTFTLQRLEVDMRCCSHTPAFYLLTHLSDSTRHWSLHKLILPQLLLQPWVSGPWAKWMSKGTSFFYKTPSLASASSARHALDQVGGLEAVRVDAGSSPSSCVH